MRNLITKCLSVPVATIAMTAAAYAGGGGEDVGSLGVIIRAISHIMTQFSSLF